MSDSYSNSDFSKISYSHPGSDLSRIADSDSLT